MKKLLHKDERGLGQSSVIILVVLVIAIAGVVGWRVMQNNKAPVAATTTAGKAVNSACLKIYNDKNLCYAAAASGDISKLSYTAVDTGTDAQGQTSKITIQNDGKGDSSFSTQAGSQTFSTVTIGTTVYTKDPATETWTKYTSSAPTTTNPSADIKASFSDANTPAAKRVQYKSLGKEACGSATCYKYQVTDPATPKATVYIWFNTKTYQMQQLQIADPASGTSTFTITYTAVKILVPSPVTEAPAATTTTAPTQAQIQAAEAQAQAAAANSGQ